MVLARNYLVQALRVDHLPPSFYRVAFSITFLLTALAAEDIVSRVLHTAVQAVPVPPRMID